MNVSHGIAPTKDRIVTQSLLAILGYKDLDGCRFGCVVDQMVVAVLANEYGSNFHDLQNILFLQEQQAFWVLEIKIVLYTCFLYTRNLSPLFLFESNEILL